MIAGLAFQVFSLFVFMSLCADFAVQARKNGADGEEGLRRCGCGRGRFYGFLIGMYPAIHPQLLSRRGLVRAIDQCADCSSNPPALAIATVTIFTRSCFRVAELQTGFGGKLANDQITFMILEGAMVVIASTALTVYHPGLIFKKFWNLDRARVEMRGKSDAVRAEKGGVILGDIRAV